MGLYPRYHIAMSLYTLSACCLTLPRNTVSSVRHILRVCCVTGDPCIDYDILLLWTVNVHIDCLCRSRSRCALSYAGSGAGNPGYGTIALTTLILHRSLPWPRAQFVTESIPNNTRFAKLTNNQSSIVRKKIKVALFGFNFAPNINCTWNLTYNFSSCCGRLVILLLM